MAVCVQCLHRRAVPEAALGRLHRGPGPCEEGGEWCLKSWRVTSSLALVCGPDLLTGEQTRTAQEEAPDSSRTVTSSEQLPSNRQKEPHLKCPPSGPPHDVPSPSPFSPSLGENN